MVSRAPVPGTMHFDSHGEAWMGPEGWMEGERWMGPEVIPASQPTPAGPRPSVSEPDWDGAPGQLSSPETMGPVTRIQDIAPIDSPIDSPIGRPAAVVQAAAENDNPLRKSFQWGSLGLDNQPGANSPVLPAVHTAVVDGGR